MYVMLTSHNFSSTSHRKELGREREDRRSMGRQSRSRPLMRPLGLGDGGTTSAARCAVDADAAQPRAPVTRGDSGRWELGPPQVAG
jgi:hypothetical protein